MEEKAVKGIEVKSKYINIQVSLDKIEKAFAALCQDAHDRAEGDFKDFLSLSFHYCRDDRDIINARSLLTTLDMAQQDNSIISDSKFDLQLEYSAYLCDLIANKNKSITIKKEIKKEITKNGLENK